MRNDLTQYWRTLSEAARRVPNRELERAARILLEAYGQGRTVFVVGNGGSAATASHFACDLAKNTRYEGAPSFRVVPLTDNVPLMTAWANDTSYERVFAEQLDALVQPGDVLVAITYSGDSPNILAAVEVACEHRATSIALTGRTGGKVRELASLTVPVPSDQIEIVEDVHSAMGHNLCVALRTQIRAAVMDAEDDNLADAVVLDIAL